MDSPNIQHAKGKTCDLRCHWALPGLTIIFSARSIPSTLNPSNENVDQGPVETVQSESRQSCSLVMACHNNPIVWGALPYAAVSLRNWVPSVIRPTAFLPDLAAATQHDGFTLTTVPPAQIAAFTLPGVASSRPWGPEYRLPHELKGILSNPLKGSKC